ncbi:Lrp/AsnC family transcriptional regulator [Kribbella kalugense]|uniref:AsnC family transcriptional regulator n=1 Tax=Kribbella kalugense TaxID=2512221 RepID=A0A4R8A0I7_9ACTN|nr:Lrp/AsnC family transcriptional regulator [Kribbella kalugense]TDW23051.1 AsnC family transcriptional regulator [Kribbella kalugense]
MTADPFDQLDRGLLHALHIDARAPFRRLGDVLGVSDQTVARRYARLRESGALRVTALSHPGRTQEVQWLLRVRAVPSAAGEVADALARRPDTSWVNLCAGGTEIECTVYGDDVGPLLLDVLPRTRQVIDVEAAEVLQVFYGGAGSPYAKAGPLRPEQIAELQRQVPEPDPTAEVVTLDELDRRLLDVLRSDGRAPIERLAKVCGVSAPTVRRRLRTLVTTGVMSFDVDADPRLQDVPARAMLRLAVTPDRLDATGRALAGHTEVAFVAATTGSTSLFAAIGSHSPDGLYRYLTTEIAGQSGVTQVNLTPVLRTVKAASMHYGVRRSVG